MAVTDRSIRNSGLAGIFENLIGSKFFHILAKTFPRTTPKTGLVEVNSLTTSARIIKKRSLGIGSRSLKIGVGLYNIESQEFLLYKGALVGCKLAFEQERDQSQGGLIDSL